MDQSLDLRTGGVYRVLFSLLSLVTQRGSGTSSCCQMDLSVLERFVLVLFMHLFVSKKYVLHYLNGSALHCMD